MHEEVVVEASPCAFRVAPGLGGLLMRGFLAPVIANAPSHANRVVGIGKTRREKSSYYSQGEVGAGVEMIENQASIIVRPW